MTRKMLTLTAAALFAGLPLASALAAGAPSRPTDVFAANGEAAFRQQQELNGVSTPPRQAPFTAIDGTLATNGAAALAHWQALEDDGGGVGHAGRGGRG